MAEPGRQHSAGSDASREAAAGLRERAARDYGVEFLEVAEFEVAVAHLRVPELVGPDRVMVPRREVLRWSLPASVLRIIRLPA